ncbi:glycosyltransferase family 2 protein [Marinobacter sediminicola]|uniref:glycosyltransferase family 2 protein n=1 Tax=Marinobacter sediminicola TaxID=3072994 RepID=UPI0028112248|nr:glycosyltransferase family 2 protein [Marinobacter sp. F26243]
MMTDTRSPKVSVITPAYNAEALISRTIESVIDQTFSDWEMIIVDDCSSDGTRLILEAWAKKDERIKVTVLGKNFGGPAGPRNVGVGIASGDYIAFLDADDIWHPQKLELQLKILENGSANFVCSQMRDFISADHIDFKRFGDYQKELVSFRQQSIRARIPTSSVVVRRELLINNPFEEDIAYKAVEDYHCWLRVLETTPNCVKVLLPLVYYRIIEGQISGSKLYMMRKVFMVHRKYPNRSFVDAIFLTLCHVSGGFYSRFLKKEM